VGRPETARWSVTFLRTEKVRREIRFQHLQIKCHPTQIKPVFPQETTRPVREILQAFKQITLIKKLFSALFHFRCCFLLLFIPNVAFFLLNYGLNQDVLGWRGNLNTCVYGEVIKLIKSLVPVSAQCSVFLPPL
jgi:hypothetical protein